MLDQGNRTFIGSVVFVDIVGYSKRSVSEQILLKDRFTSMLANSLTDVALEQRIILDTGDGAAMSFLGDPEDALFVGMHMREFLQRTYADLGLPAGSAPEDIEIGPQGALSVRIGINLGPVKLLRDINGHPNIVGDGINVAQRIMTFARPGQIVVSRSYFDVVSVISDEYAKLFKYEGSRTDKHVREHEIYVVGESVAAFNQARAGLANRAASTNPKARPPELAATATSTQWLRDYGVVDSTGIDSLPFYKDREKLTIAASILGALVLALVVASAMKKPTEPTTPEVAVTASIAQPVSPAVTAPNPAAVSQDNAKPSEPVPAAAAISAPAPQSPLVLLPGSETTASSLDAAKITKSASAKESAAEVAKAAALKSADQGTLRLRIDPWGLVFVNGRSIGLSPPLKEYKLAPGKYKIQVKNTTFAPFETSIEIRAKDEVGIKHKFQ